jgi:hypothetical protein
MRIVSKMRMDLSDNRNNLRRDLGITPRRRNVPKIKSVGSAPARRATLEGPLVVHRGISWGCGNSALRSVADIIERFAEPD